MGLWECTNPIKLKGEKSQTSCLLSHIKWVLCRCILQWCPHFVCYTSCTPFIFTAVPFRTPLKFQNHSQPGSGMFSSVNWGQVSHVLMKPDAIWIFDACLSLSLRYHCLKQPKWMRELYLTDLFSHLYTKYKQHHKTPSVSNKSLCYYSFYGYYCKSFISFSVQFDSNTRKNKLYKRYV